VRRVGLLLAAAAVPVIAGCGTAPRVPEWKAGGAPPRPAESSPVAAPAPPPSPAEPSPEPSPTTAPTSIAPVVAAPAPSAGFVSVVRGRLPEVAVDLRTEEITDLGDQACAGLAAGQRRVTVAETLSGYGLSAPDAAELVTIADAHLCRA
jgi:hypothetical protein